MVINGRPHGPWKRTTVCQLHMREYKDGDEIWIEPWRAKASRCSRICSWTAPRFDRIMQAGRLRSATGPVARRTRTRSRWPGNADGSSMDAAACIGCGACVAACPNASAMLFTSRQDRPPEPAAAGSARAVRAGAGHGPDQWRPRLRQLHEPRRVRECVPQGDRARRHRVVESGLHGGGSEGRLIPVARCRCERVEVEIRYAFAPVTA